MSAKVPVAAEAAALALAAAHPATSAARLARRAAKYPAEVLANPVLPLLLLAQPDWFAGLPRPALRALLRVPPAPATVAPALLQAAQDQPDALTLLLLAGHPQLPPAGAAQLRQSPDARVANAATFRPDAPPPPDWPAALRVTLDTGFATELKELPAYAPHLYEELLGVPGVVPPGRLPWYPRAAQAVCMARHYEYAHRVAHRFDLPPAQRLALLQPLVAQFTAIGLDTSHLAESLAINALSRPPAPAGAAAAPRRPALQAALAAAADPATAPAEVARLLAHPAKQVRQLALRHPRLPAEALPALLKGASCDNRRGLLHSETGRQVVLRAMADSHPTACFLLQLLLPEALTAAHRAALAASPLPAHRLAVAHLPEYQAQLRHDPHLLVRLVARGEAPINLPYLN
ncbi:hypothetical protein GCM10027422_27590 [Hymenobacter arcticus]